MVRLTWGQVLSIVLPGTVVIVALRYHVPAIFELTDDLNDLSVTAGISLLLVSGIAGGVVGGIRRLIVDEIILNRCFTFRNDDASENKEPTQRGNGADEEKPIFYFLDQDNISVFEAGVDQSFRFYTFYANLAIALISLVTTRTLHRGLIAPLDISGIVLVVILFLAAYVQYAYFKQFRTGFVERARNEIDSN